MRLKPLQLAQMRSDPTWHARDLPKQMVRGQSSLPHHKATCHPAFIPVVTSSVDCCQPYFDRMGQLRRSANMKPLL